MSESQQRTPANVSAAETHIGVVFFIGERAYKLKKPVDLGFLDFRDRTTRLWACRRELELNRRLAPDVYIDVLDIGPPAEDPCDHLLVMRRMPADRSLATLVESQEPVEGAVREIARTLADFHAYGQRDDRISAEGTPEAVRARWEDNIQALRDFTGDLLDGDTLDEIERRCRDFLDGQEALFSARISDDHIVDGHGDLLSEDIFCLDDGPRILDCIEFDDSLRYIDALDDAACLAMDLEYRGDPALAHRFLDWYVQFSADSAPASLRHHYEAYRALVRTKVACLKHSAGDRAAAADAREHFQLALHHMRRTTPELILVGGLPGTGKSTISEKIADHIGAALLSSDLVRKELGGLSPTDTASDAYRSGLYAPENTDRTYSDLTRRAEALLTHGESVVLDASWTRDEHRQLARQTASHTHSELIAYQCTAPDELVSERLRARTDTASDADENIARALAQDTEPWPEATTLDTGKAPEDAVEHALRVLTPGSRT